MKFIHVSLCDNDFAYELQFAVKYVFENFPDKTSEEFKDAVVALVVALVRVKNKNSNCEKYLSDSIEVLYTDRPPSIDHDYGSVAVDVSTGYIWRY